MLFKQFNRCILFALFSRVWTGDDGYLYVPDVNKATWYFCTGWIFFVQGWMPAPPSIREVVNSWHHRYFIVRETLWDIKTHRRRNHVLSDLELGELDFGDRQSRFGSCFRSPGTTPRFPRAQGWHMA